MLRSLPRLAPPRFYSSTPRLAPKTIASNLISAFPIGSSLVQKSSSILVASSLAAFAISKEIYIVDHEFFEMVCIFGAYYLWYFGFGEAAKEYLRERKEVLMDARVDHKEVVKERMAHISKLKDVVEVTQNLFGVSKELAKMEAEAYELKQKVQFQQEIKSTLDAWVRHEAQVREKQQSLLVESVLEKVNESLRNPRIYGDILAQTLLDVEKIAKAAK